MSSNVEEKILEKVRALPLERQEEVLAFLEGLVSQPQPRRMSIFEQIDSITAQVPDELWEELPKDGSLNVDHYLYGAPKK